ncbi:MAG TPA: sn-glycerol-3-phosphate ABC transporter ATP-binding protein UgpC [Gemmatimonadales bacterium]|nr:sn-glycerol-3-phosphate ABC transporter ATP-binding protein UgpC [Gemmatimonadales bacterium]
MASVTLAGIRKIYPTRTGGHTAVHDLSLEIPDGEFMVLVGPSGCGKSTTLRMVAGLETPSGGEIRIGERVVTDVPPRDRDIAMVFQNYALYPHMTARENMAFALRLRKLPAAEIEKRVGEAAQALDIERLIDRRPREMSGGERQRVALGRALVRQPAVFLFDEPLSNLDARLRVQMRREIARLHRLLGVTMIYVTHDQVEAMTLGDRIAVMNRGRVMQVAPPATLYDTPANLFTAGFIGSPPMNLIPGRVEARTFIPAGIAGRIPLGTAAAATPEGSDLVLGVRPEHLRVASGSPDSAAGFPATVELAEPLGHEVLLGLRSGTTDLVARMPPTGSVRAGEQVRLTPDQGYLHLFDAASEDRLA